MVPASLSLLLMLFFLPVVNLLSNEVAKTSREQCSRHTKAGRKNSYLWTLQGYPSVYIFGTIHRPHTLIWPQIPRNVKKAFKSSKRIYFEIDLTSPEYLLAIKKCQYLPDKQTLMNVLPSRVFNKLQNYFKYIQSQISKWLKENKIEDRMESGDITKNWERKRPVWILLQLGSLNKEYVQSRTVPPLDLYMFFKGQQAGKNIGHLESPEEHCKVNSLNSSQVITYLDEILTNYNHTRKEKDNQLSRENLTYHYFCGNLSSYLFSPQVNDSRQPPSTLQTLRNFENSLTEELFLRRNKQITRKIIQEIKLDRRRRNRRIFFAIGAGHLVGKGSIIELLNSKGFKPKHILATDKLPRSRRFKMNDQRYWGKKLKSKKKKAVKQSFPTITSTFLKTEQAVTQESKVNVYCRSPSMNLGVQTKYNIFMTFFLSFVLHIVIY